MLYLLGLPNQGPSGQPVQVDPVDRAQKSTYLIALGPAPLQQAVGVGLLMLPWPEPEVEIELNGRPASLGDLKKGMRVAIQFRQSRSKKQGQPAKILAWDQEASAPPEGQGQVGEVVEVWPDRKKLQVSFKDAKQERVFNLDRSRVHALDFKSLYLLGFDREQQREWEGKKVQVVGQFAPRRPSDPYFTLVRFRIQCCAGDAVQLSIPVIFESGTVRDIKHHPRANDWVAVTGRVEFQEVRGGGGVQTVLVASDPGALERRDPEPDPYIR
jgi:hypothetical protein